MSNNQFALMSDLFNKHIKKATARTKEKLLEGLGKAKATQDDAFDFHVANLNKQSKACERLHKDLKAYAAALKQLSGAEKALRETIREAYEPEWPDREHIMAATQSLDIQTDELEKTVCEDLTASVQQYVTQFADLKKKVDKRGRKLVDYDHAKNNYNSLRASSKKGDTDPKVAKAFTELQQAEQLYKELNRELLEVLPATFDSRITFTVDTLQCLFNSHSAHQTESSKLNKQVVTQLDRLGESMDSLRVDRPEGGATTPIPPPASASPGSRAETPVMGDSQSNGSQTPPQHKHSVASTNPSVVSTPAAIPASSPAATPAATPAKEEEKEVEEVFENKLYPKLAAAPRNSPKADPKKKEKRVRDPTNPFDESDDEEEGEGEKKKEEERKVVYVVMSTHEYKAVDTDELSFGPDEEIQVLSSSDADQLDDGWQMGRKADGTEGVFPENFTHKKE